MSHQPLLSVVVPCLNRAHFLVPTLESILRQDYPAVECIVIDGGSTDGTREILQRYEGRVRWVSEPDGGHADAINKGFRMARGEILAWLNADDVWAVPGAASTAVAYLQAHPEVDLVYGDCGAIDAEGKAVGMSYLRRWDLEYAVEQCDHSIPQPAAFMRRGILEKVGWLDTSFVSKKDHELWLRVGLSGTIHYVPVLLAHARACPGYMAQRGDATAAACVALTSKFFTLPGVPRGLMRRRRRALSNAYLQGAKYAWRDGGHWRTTLGSVARGTVADPINAAAAAGRFAASLGVGALGPIQPWWRLIRRARQWMKEGGPPCTPNLAGDRDVEWSWIAAHLPSGPGEALDFGNGGGPLGLMAAERGFEVTAVDLAAVGWPYVHPRLRLVQGDILALQFPTGHFDLVINCSTVEHVGLVGRYGVAESRRDGDLESMARLRQLLKPSGTMLLTVPLGLDAVFAPITRVYGAERLPRLLEGYEIQTESYWVKDGRNLWVPCSRQAAIEFQASAGSWNPLRNVYALGCFVLTPAR